MSHEHVIYDTSGRFIIDPETSEIISGYEILNITQYDHNSKRYSFSMPRFLNGHDMSLCSSVEIHFDNISRNKREVNSDVYPVDDLSISDDDNSTVTFTWLVSRSATQISGRLTFAVHFHCVSEDGTYEYAWHTSIFDSIAISATKKNTAGLETEYSDFISKILAKLDTISGYTNWTEEQIRQIIVGYGYSTFSGNYNDLSNLPAIPDAVTDDHINSLIDAKLEVIENGTY